MFSFAFKSRIPGTKEWRYYRATVKFVQDVEAFTAKAIGGWDEPFPTPIPRSPLALGIAVDSMMALARAVAVGINGGGGELAAAVFSEHAPDLTGALL